MKPIHANAPGYERPGILLDDGNSAHTQTPAEDYSPAFFADGGLERLAQWATTNASAAPRLYTAARLGPTIQRPGKLICIGLNYRAHAKESGWRPRARPRTDQSKNQRFA